MSYDKKNIYKATPDEQNDTDTESSPYHASKPTIPATPAESALSRDAIQRLQESPNTSNSDSERYPSQYQSQSESPRQPLLQDHNDSYLNTPRGHYYGTFSPYRQPIRKCKYHKPWKWIRWKEIVFTDKLFWLPLILVATILSMFCCAFLPILLITALITWIIVASNVRPKQPFIILVL